MFSNVTLSSVCVTDETEQWLLKRYPSWVCMKVDLCSQLHKSHGVTGFVLNQAATITMWGCWLLMSRTKTSSFCITTLSHPELKIPHPVAGFLGCNWNARLVSKACVCVCGSGECRWEPLRPVTSTSFLVKFCMSWYGGRGAKPSSPATAHHSSNQQPVMDPLCCVGLQPQSHQTQ